MRWENYGAGEEAKQEQMYIGRSLNGPPNPFTLLPTSTSPITYTQQPYVTGTSVLGLKYRDGVLVAADTAGSYGSTTRYKSVERLKAVSNTTLLGATGEISDFQALTQLLDRLIVTDAMWDDGNNLGPLDIHNFLTRVMYNRRNKFDPLWNSLILGGVKNGVKYLGSVIIIRN